MLSVAISKFCSYKNDIESLICRNPSLTDVLMQVRDIKGTCCICSKGDTKVINIPCNTDTHLDRICQECCQELLRCPLCRGQLRRSCQIYDSIRLNEDV